MPIVCLLSGAKAADITLDVKTSDIVGFVKAKNADLKKIPTTHLRIAKHKLIWTNDHELSEWKWLFVEVLPECMQIVVIGSKDDRKTIQLDFYVKALAFSLDTKQT